MAKASTKKPAAANEPKPTPKVQVSVPQKQIEWDVRNFTHKQALGLERLNVSLVLTGDEAKAFVRMHDALADLGLLQPQNGQPNATKTAALRWLLQQVAAAADGVIDD